MKSKNKIGILIIIIAVLAMLLAYFFIKKNAVDKLQTTIEAQLLQLVDELEITLERHLYLPSLLTNDKEISEFLRTKPNTALFTQRQENINLSLELTNNISGTSSIFILAPDGKVISSSNWAEKDSFIDQNFSSWPYFIQASQNALGRYFSSQSEGGERFYYFARSVQHNAKVIGIIVAQVALSDIAFNWTLENDFIITDNNGVVFLSNNKAFDLNTISKFSIDLIDAHQRYRNNKLLPLNENNIDITYEGFQLITLLKTKYQMLSKRMELAGWHVRVLSKYSNARKEIIRNVSISGILIFLIATLAWIVSNIQNQRQAFRQRTRANLESKIRERTKELKKSQEDLIQAAKMAALGQLSTGITHEINNPLTAIRAYADNAEQFLQKERLDMVESNLKEITKLTENMASITGQLKSFARKSKGELIAVDIEDAIKNALSIVHSKIVSSGAVLQFETDSNKDSKLVLADKIWLSQILVNIISNAISATNNNTERNLWISIREQRNEKESYYYVDVRDNGTGIEEGNMKRIFEPFFTTKPTSKGLGLGLSISFNLAKDMNGSLEARNHEKGGALFTLCLPAANTNKV